MTASDKLNDLLVSRKFWALVLSLVVDGLGVLYHGVTPEVAILAALGSLAAYSTATGIESAGQAQAEAQVASAKVIAKATEVTVAAQSVGYTPTIKMPGSKLQPRG